VRDSLLSWPGGVILVALTLLPILSARPATGVERADGWDAFLSNQQSYVVDAYLLDPVSGRPWHRPTRVPAPTVPYKTRFGWVLGAYLENRVALQNQFMPAWPSV
jgi:hypothetical protein